MAYFSRFDHYCYLGSNLSCKLSYKNLPYPYKLRILNLVVGLFFSSKGLNNTLKEAAGRNKTMAEPTLEALIKDADRVLDLEEEVDEEELLQKHVAEDSEKSEIYEEFLSEYVSLKSNYLEKKKKYSFENLLERKTGEKVELDLRNIAKNAFWGGVVGSNVYDSGNLLEKITTVLTGAAVGAYLTYYNQKEKANMSLGGVFWWSIIGANIFGRFNPEGSSMYSILGAVAGCAIKTYLELRGKDPRLSLEQKMKKLIELDMKYPQDIHKLIEDTKEELYHAKEDKWLKGYKEAFK